MKRAKGIDELYEEIREFDLVITTDAALATALNARVDRAIIGPFAVTPKQIAASVSPRVMKRPLLSELQVISSVSEETGMSLKYVHSELENIKEIRKYTREVKKHLHTRSANLVYDSYEGLPTLERVMGLFVPDEDEYYEKNRIAVIADELFNDLDKHFIPLDYEPVSLFSYDNYEIDTIYEVGNDRQLAENAVDMIDPDHPSDYAIVLNTSGPMADAVRTALYRRRMAFKNSLNVRDLSQIRDYLQFITLALNFETIRVKYVKELFSNYNGFFKKGREEFLLCKQTEDDMTDHGRDLWEVMRDIHDMTFGEVCDSICDNRAHIQVNSLIVNLGMRDRKVTMSLLNEIKYAVDNVQDLHHNEEIPPEEKNGVLLVDCNNSIYVDRPVVIYLGMEQDWNKTLVGKPYLDVEDETDKNVERLNALLQQGSVRYYLVNSTKNGKTARPSTLFDLLYRRPTESFSDICSNLVKGRWHQDVKALLPDIEGPKDTSSFKVPFSKSSFNAYYSCPRKFLFNELLTTPEKKSTEFGNLIHYFAEFYICYPNDVRELGVDHFVTLISDRYSGLSSPLMEPLDIGRIRKAMESVIEYIDRLGIKDVPLDVPISKKKYPNKFMEALGKEFTSSVCEQGFTTKDELLYGKLDLLWEGIITDYKTGKPLPTKDIVKAMTFGSGADHPDFQAPIYLCLSSEFGQRNVFNLFYAMDNDVTGTDISQNIRTVRIKGETLIDAMRDNRDLISDMENDLSSKLQSKAEIIISTIVSEASGIPDEWDKDGDLITDLLIATGLKDNKTNRGTMEPAVRKVAKRCANGVVTTTTAVYIPRETLDRTIGMIRDLHDEMIKNSE